MVLMDQGCLVASLWIHDPEPGFKPSIRIPTLTIKEAVLEQKKKEREKGECVEFCNKMLCLYSLLFYSHRA